jgi:DNA (cytosine-5)-methyltransferase 1
MSQFKFIDLFAGIGGFHHALKSLGGECVLTCELDPQCELVYKSIFPSAKKPGHFVNNIRTITRKDVEDPDSGRSVAAIKNRVEEHDILCAGFPCQPFSKSGHQLGFKDSTRGTLFFDIMEIVYARKPQFLILENVRNLAGPRHRDTWAIIRDTIREAGYVTLDEPIVLSPHILHPDDDGAPQVRERVFILASRDKSHFDRMRHIQADIETGDISRGWNQHRWRISKILLPDTKIKNVEKYRLSDDELGWVEAWEWFVQNIPDENLPGFPIWSDQFKLEPEIPEDCPGWKRIFLVKNSQFYKDHKSIIDRWKKMKWGKSQKTVSEFPPSRQLFEWQAKRAHPCREGRTLRDLVLQFRPSGIRVKPPTYLPALVAITQTSVVGPDVKAGIKEYRELTPQEAAELQCMPHDVFEASGIDDKAAYKQLGNAVNVGVVRYLANRLINPEAVVKGQQKLRLNFDR